jgi:uncharacterized lipoprotein YddW (UPF0748 family)
MKVAHKGGSVEIIPLAHTMNMEHIAWFEAGSALNLIRLNSGQASLKNGVEMQPPVAA